MSLPVFAANKVVKQTEYFNPYYTQQAYYGGDYVPSRRYARRSASKFYDINDLEKYAFNKNFPKETDIIRLERLETFAFGAIQDGDIYTRYDNARNAILTRPKQNYKTSLLKNISEYFSGQMTGITPSVTSTTNSSNFYNNFNNIYPYGKSSNAGFSSPWSRGYRTENYGIGTGSSVHILD